jgi:hypothetical protein
LSFTHGVVLLSMKSAIVSLHTIAKVDVFVNPCLSKGWIFSLIYFG